MAFLHAHTTMTFPAPSIAFLPVSSFTPPPQRPVPASQPRTNHPTMVAPKHVRRTEEIKRIQKQLEELRAARENLANAPSNGDTSNTSAPSSSPLSAPTSSAPTTSPSFNAAATRDGPKDTPAPEPDQLKFGLHGADSHFLSISSVDQEEGHPLILPIAGNIPGLSGAALRDTAPMLYNKPPVTGNLFIARMPASSHAADIIALPYSKALEMCADPVAVLANERYVSASRLPCAQGDDIALVVDRVSGDFSPREFYLWEATGGGELSVGWADVEPPQSEARRVARVVYGILETDAELRKNKSCWEEENETYM